MRKRKLLLPLDDDATVRWALARRRKALRAAALRKLPAAAGRHAVVTATIESLVRAGFDGDDPAHEMAIRSHDRSQQRLCQLLLAAVGDRIEGPLLGGDAGVAGVDLGDRVVVLIATPAIGSPIATARLPRPDGGEEEVLLRVATLPAGAILRHQEPR